MWRRIAHTVRWCWTVRGEHDDVEVETDVMVIQAAGRGHMMCRHGERFLLQHAICYLLCTYALPVHAT